MRVAISWRDPLNMMDQPVPVGRGGALGREANMRPLHTVQPTPDHPPHRGEPDPAAQKNTVRREAGA